MQTDPMKIYRDFEQLTSDLNQNTVITVGNFDGVHLAHQQLIDFVVKTAQDHHLYSIVVLFEPQPLESLFPEKHTGRLFGLSDKLKILESHNIDCVLVVTFTKDFARLSAKEFIETILVGKLRMKYLVEGEDFHFGAKNTGDLNMLEMLSQQLNFKLTHFKDMCLRDFLKPDQIPNSLSASRRISSQWVKECIEQDDLLGAKILLGYPYTINGQVVHGDHRGKQLKYPTANILIPSNTVLSGVYAVHIKGADPKILKGVANVGTRPTFDGKLKILEVLILDFSKDLYDQNLEIIFLKKIRPEKKFGSEDQLKDQIQKDIQRTRQLFDQGLGKP